MLKLTRQENIELIEINNRIVGIAKYVIYKDYISLTNLNIYKKNVGIGTKFLNKLKEFEMPIKLVCTNKRAMNFYIKNGFVSVIHRECMMWTPKGENNGSII